MGSKLNLHSGQIRHPQSLSERNTCNVRKINVKLCFTWYILSEGQMSQ